LPVSSSVRRQFMSPPPGRVSAPGSIVCAHGRRHAPQRGAERMEFKRGRMIDHVQLRTKDLEASKRFYQAVLGVIGIPVTDGGEYLSADELWIDAGETPSHVHLAFQAPDRETVDRFYRAGLEAGGRDN